MKKILIMLATIILTAGGCATWSDYQSGDNSDSQPDTVLSDSMVYSGNNQNQGTIHHPRPKPGIHKPVHQPKPKPGVHKPVHQPKPKPSANKPVHHPKPKPGRTDKR